MNCKHNWKESDVARTYRKKNEYFFGCQRCGEYRYVVLNRVSARSPVVHAGGDQQAAARAKEEETQS